MWLVLTKERGPCRSPTEPIVQTLSAYRLRSPSVCGTVVVTVDWSAGVDLDKGSDRRYAVYDCNGAANSTILCRDTTRRGETAEYWLILQGTQEM